MSILNLKEAIEVLIAKCNSGALTVKEAKTIINLANGKSNKIIEVDTPLGVITAKQGPDSAYPGIYIDFKPAGSSYDRSVALVEYEPMEDDEKGIVRLVEWGQKGNINDDTDYTSASTIYDHEDLKFAASKLTDEAKKLVEAIPDGSNGRYKIVGSDNGCALVRDMTLEKNFRVNVEEL